MSIIGHQMTSRHEICAGRMPLPLRYGIVREYGSILITTVRLDLLRFFPPTDGFCLAGGVPLFLIDFTVSKCKRVQIFLVFFYKSNRRRFTRTRYKGTNQRKLWEIDLFYSLVFESLFGSIRPNMNRDSNRFGSE